MKRTKQHEIDEGATRIVKGALPTAWALREQKPDYGIDYEVEIFKSEEPTGLVFAVQQKGKKTLHRTGSAIPFPLEVDHLVYYMDRCRHPVFLVVVDVKKSEAFWLFLQEHVLSPQFSKNWRGQKFITVHVPVSQPLSNTDALRKAVQEADQFMSKLHPSSIEAAVKGTEQRLQSLDPRFSIEIQTAGGLHCYQLFPNENIPVTFSAKSDRGSKLISDLINRGLPIRVARGEIDVHGSALVQWLFQQDGAVIQHARRSVATVELSAIDSNGQKVARFGSLPALVEGGLKEARLHAQIPRTPLLVELKCVVTGTEPPLECTAKISFLPRIWAGQGILALAYFDQLHGLLTALQQGCDLQFDFLSDGNPVLTDRIPNTSLDALLETADIVNGIAKAREIARWFSVEPSFPEKLTWEDVEGIENVHWHLAPGERRMPGRDFGFTSQTPKQTVRQFLETAPHDVIEGAILIRRDNAVAVLMGQEISVGLVEVEITKARVILTLEELKEVLDKTQGEEMSLPWVGAEDSEIVVRRPA